MDTVEVMVEEKVRVEQGDTVPVRLGVELALGLLLMLEQGVAVWLRDCDALPVKLGEAVVEGLLVRERDTVGLRDTVRVTVPQRLELMLREMVAEELLEAEGVPLEDLQPLPVLEGVGQAVGVDVPLTLAHIVELGQGEALVLCEGDPV